MNDVVLLRTPVGLFVGGERVGSALLEAHVVPFHYVAKAQVVGVQLDTELQPGEYVEAHFLSALQGVAYLAAQSPERVGKDC